MGKLSAVKLLARVELNNGCVLRYLHGMVGVYVCTCVHAHVCVWDFLFFGGGGGTLKRTSFVFYTHYVVLGVVKRLPQHSKVFWFPAKMLWCLFPRSKKNPSLTEGEHLTLSLAASPMTETCPSLLCRMKNEPFFFKPRSWEKDREEWAMQLCPLGDSMTRLCLHISLVFGKLQA